MAVSGVPAVHLPVHSFKDFGGGAGSADVLSQASTEEPDASGSSWELAPSRREASVPPPPAAIVPAEGRQEADGSRAAAWGYQEDDYGIFVPPALAAGVSGAKAPSGEAPLQPPALLPPPPSSWLPHGGLLPDTMASWGERVARIVESARSALEASYSPVVCAEAVQGQRGWVITAYVPAVALKTHRSYLVNMAQQAIMFSVDWAPNVFLVGYAANPFSPMPLGFGLAIADMPDKSRACWESYSLGFCESPSTCCREHPKARVGIQVCLKPARRR